MRKEILTICDTKYTFVFEDIEEQSDFRCDRYGEQWRSFNGDGAVLQLFLYAKQLQAELVEWREALQSLCNQQNGPPLIRDQKQWQAAMNEANILLSKP